MIVASRYSIIQNLLAYGDDDNAKQIDHLSDADINQIGEIAAKYIGSVGYIAKHNVLGAIEFLEGEKREPKRKRRDLSFYIPKEPKPRENLIWRIFE